jgi:phosphatidylinositol phospholipase C delta
MHSLAKVKTSFSKEIHNFYCDEQDDVDEEDDDESEEEDPKFQPDTACEYRKLITIHAGKPKGHLRDALKVDPDKVRRLSLSETQLSKATISHGADIIR